MTLQSCLLDSLRFALDTGADDLNLLDPDQYTMIPVPLKIIKLLVLELGPTIGGMDAGRMYAGGLQAAPASEGSDEEGGDWEDEPSGLNIPGMSNEGRFMAQFVDKGEIYAYITQKYWLLLARAVTQGRRTMRHM